jgi:hypothetical protein
MHCLVTPNDALMQECRKPLTAALVTGKPIYRSCRQAEHRRPPTPSQNPSPTSSWKKL